MLIALPNSLYSRHETLLYDVKYQINQGTFGPMPEDETNSEDWEYKTYPKDSLQTTKMITNVHTADTLRSGREHDPVQDGSNFMSKVNFRIRR